MLDNNLLRLCCPYIFNSSEKDPCKKPVIPGTFRDESSPIMLILDCESRDQCISLHTYSNRNPSLGNEFRCISSRFDYGLLARTRPAEPAGGSSRCGTPKMFP